MRSRRLAVAIGTVGTLGVLAAGLTISTSASASSQNDCTAHELPLPGDIGPNESVDIVGSDPSGRYVLATLYGGPGLLWKDGEFEAKLTGLPDLDGYIDFQGVNSSGVVVAVTEPGNDGYTPWKYENGKYTVLEGGANWVEDINENGDIVGTISNERTMVWPGGDPDSGQKLPGNVTGTALSDEGIVVGEHTTQDGVDIPYYWPDPNGEPERLELPTGVTSAWPSEMSGDWVIADDYTTDQGRGVLWNLADGTAEKLPYFPTSVNSAGDIGSSGAIHRADGSTVELPSPAGSDAVPWASTVTERGSEQVAVGGYEASKDVYRPLTWTC